MKRLAVTLLALALLGCDQTPTNQGPATEQNTRIERIDFFACPPEATSEADCVPVGELATNVYPGVVGQGFVLKMIAQQAAFVTMTMYVPDSTATAVGWESRSDTSYVGVRFYMDGDHRLVIKLFASKEHFSRQTYDLVRELLFRVTDSVQ